MHSLCERTELQGVKERDCIPRIIFSNVLSVTIQMKNKSMLYCHIMIQNWILYILYIHRLFAGVILRFNFSIFFLCLFFSIYAYPSSIPYFSKTDYALSAYSSILLVNDINNDGTTDIVSVCKMGLISIFLGNGDGTFLKEKYLSPGVYMSFFLPGDYNKDGNIDFVTNGKILLGDGKSGFLIHDIMMGAGDFTYGASGDMNGDGCLDLVLGDHLNVLINNGDGTFQFEYSIFPDKSVHLLNIKDYNKDGFPDLILEYSEFDMSSINYIPSIKNKVWGEPIGILGPYSWPYTYFPTQNVDFNKDESIDLIICLENGYDYVYLGNGKGYFYKSFEIEGTIVERSGKHEIFVMDIDNDNKDDIVVLTDCVFSEPRKGCLSYYPGKKDGTFGSLSIIDLNLPRPHYTLIENDFNSDGLIDFAIGTLDSIETPGLSIFLSRRIVSVKDNEQSEEISILKCFPNPFNTSVMISYRLYMTNNIKVEIYDILGRKIKNLFCGRQEYGNYSLSWKGDDESGNYVSCGLFFCLIRNESGKVLKSNKIMFMK